MEGQCAQRLFNHRTNEDAGMIMRKIMSVSRKKQAKMRDIDCRNGKHGFTVNTWLSGYMIHNKCTNCGAYWSRPDMPMTI